MPWGNKFPDMKNDPTYLEGRLSNAETSLAEIVTVKPSGGDDTQQITTALTTNIGKKIRFLPGSYSVSGSSSINIPNDCVIEFQEGASIDVTNCTANPIFNFNGNLGTFYLMGANASKGDRTITVNSSLSSILNEGDIIKLTTNTTYGGSGELWNTGRAYYYKGELCEVLSVSGNIITLKNALNDNYTATNTVAGKMNFIKVSLSNFTMKGNINNEQIGVQVLYGKNVFVKGGNIKGTSYSALQLNNVFNAEVDGFKASNLWIAGLGTNYGVAIASSQYVSIQNCSIIGGRHAITTGGNEPTRYVIVANNPSLDNDPNSGASCLDTHSNTEHVKFINNIIKAGVSISGINTEVSGNSFIGKVESTGYSIDIIPEANKTSDYYIIKDNIINTPSTDTNNQASIQFDIRNDYTINHLVIENNTIITSSGFGVFLTTSSAPSNVNVNIIDCSISGNMITALNIGIYTSGRNSTNLINFNRLKMFNNKISVDNSPSNVQPVFIINTAITLLNVLNNIITTNELSSHTFELLQTTVQDIIFNGNVIYNTQSAFYTITLTATRYIEFLNNLLDGYKSSGGVTLNAPDIYRNGNKKYNVLGAESLTGRYYHDIYGNGNVITSGTVAPTTGTWILGDKCINISPAVGSPKGWVCTTAGTPGTWTSEGNL